MREPGEPGWPPPGEVIRWRRYGSNYVRPHMSFRAVHPRNIPAAYHKPIGQLLVRWGFTELYLQSILWHVWNIADPKVARLLTWEIRAEAKVALFKMLARRWISDPTNKTELLAIASAADKLRIKRNRVAHGLWGHKVGEPKVLRLLQIKGETRILPKSEVVTARDIAGWAAELDSLNKRLLAFHRKLGASRP